MMGLKTLNIKFSCLKICQVAEYLEIIKKKKVIQLLNEMSMHIMVDDVIQVILSLGSVMWHSRCLR